MPIRHLPMAALLLALAASPAAAHAILIDSTPAPEGHVHPGTLNVIFRYNSRIDVPRSKLTLTAPDGTLTRLPATAGGKPDLLLATARVAQGDYALHWQVLAIDGHITRGNVPFTVDAQ